MPFTFNGVGTWYYGKKNRMRKTGTCEFCSRTTTLESYETREYVVVLFIPLIPLRKFQILDSCRICQQHRRLSASEFQAELRAEIDAAKAAAAADPDDIEALLRLCQLLLGFRQAEGAKKAYLAFIERCPDRASAHYGLASALNGLGQFDQAQEAYERAFSLDPTQDFGLVEYAQMLWGLSRKRESLDVLKARAEQNWDSSYFLASLADHARWVKDFATAAGAYGRLLELQPGLSGDKAFMKIVRQTHKKAGVPLALA